MINIQNTADCPKPSLVLCLYGLGKSGKTTLATTAPKPLVLDGENGVKGLRTSAISVPYVAIRTWKDIQECYEAFKDNKDYETIIIDPLGAFMDALIDDVAGPSGMTLQKWGIAIEKFKKFVRAWTLTGKHVIFVAHDTFTPDDGVQLRSIQLPGKELPKVFRNMMDIVGYYAVENNGKRTLQLQPNMKIDAGTRFNCFPPIMEVPKDDREFITKMIATIHASYEPAKIEAPKV